MLARELLVASDVDGCVVDAGNHKATAGLPALRALSGRGVSLILATSKTRVEMEHLAQTLGLQSPMIVENGGAILLPRGDGRYDVVAQCGCRADLVRALAEIARETGARVRGFATLAAEELRRLTGQSLDAAARALHREYDEPFLLEDEAKAAAVLEAAERRGLRVTHGGRFHHLTAPTDKGRAFRALVARFARRGLFFETVGLGDAANDLPLLRAVDRPIIVPRPGGGVDPALATLQGAELAPRPGPKGWNAAVLTVLAGKRLQAWSGAAAPVRAAEAIA